MAERKIPATVHVYFDNVMRSISLFEWMRRCHRKSVN